MKTWRPEQLTRGAQTLVREKLAVEYAPGRIAAADLAATPAMRARLVCPLLPDGSTPATLTAAWIYTGWWPPSRLRRLCAAHPTSRHHCVVYRAQLEEEYSRELGGFTVPARARRARRRRRMRHTPYARRPQPGRSAAAQQTRKAASGRALRPKGGQGTGNLHRGNEVA